MPSPTCLLSVLENACQLLYLYFNYIEKVSTEKVFSSVIGYKDRKLNSVLLSHPQLVQRVTIYPLQYLVFLKIINSLVNFFSSSHEIPDQSNHHTELFNQQLAERSRYSLLYLPYYSIQNTWVNITTIDMYFLLVWEHSFRWLLNLLSFWYVMNLYALVLLTGTEPGPKSEFKTWSCRW